MKYFLEVLKTKKSKKIILIFVIFVVLFYSLLYIYSSTYESEKMDIDRYNFNQLTQIKPILKTLDRGSIGFYYIGEFNKIYHTNISPKKNCYYISNENGVFPYIFGFQLESLFYNFLYFGKNYAYPMYNIPDYDVCFGYLIHGATGGCQVIGKEKFINKISKPCDKYELE